MLALVVVDLVGEAEELAQPAAVRQALGGAQFARVGIDHDVGLAVGAHRQHSHDAAGVVDELMGAALTAGEGADVARAERARAVGGAKGGPALQDDEELLLGEVVVVGVGGLAGSYRPGADAEAFGAELVTDASAARAEAVVLARLVVVGAVEVAHRGRAL